MNKAPRILRFAAIGLILCVIAVGYVAGEFGASGGQIAAFSNTVTVQGNNEAEISAVTGIGNTIQQAPAAQPETGGGGVYLIVLVVIALAVYGFWRMLTDGVFNQLVYWSLGTVALWRKS